MKKILLIVLMVLVVGVTACGQTVYYKNEATLQWDAVTTDADGNPLLPTDTLTYEVYIYDYNVGVADPQSIGDLTFIAGTPLLEQLIVFPYRTTWAAGVRTKLVDGDANITCSPLAWSYIPEDADIVSGPFLYSPFGIPDKPEDLRDSGM